MATERRIWTDGACRGNPGPGGWAWVADDDRWASGAEAQSTNQRMEIVAAHRAVLDHAEEPGRITVVSDSTYVVNCFRDSWWKGWLSRDWRNSQKKPVANRELWEPFIDLYRERGDIGFEWVKGHSGDARNDAADRLAVAASHAQVESSGDVLPDLDALVADAMGSDSSTNRPTNPQVTGDESSTNRSQRRDRRLPEGRLVGVFGARPPELGGYDANPVSDRVGRRLQEILAAKRLVDPDLHVVSGLRLGAEMLGAEAALAEGVPLVAVLPFPDADSPWPEASRRRFARLREAAVVEVLLERKAPGSKAEVAGSLQRRDAWLARNVDEAVVVWDGRDRFVERLVRTLQDQLDDEVWEELVEPT